MASRQFSTAERNCDLRSPPHQFQNLARLDFALRTRCCSLVHAHPHDALLLKGFARRLYQLDQEDADPRGQLLASRKLEDSAKRGRTRVPIGNRLMTDAA